MFKLIIYLDFIEFPTNNFPVSKSTSNKKSHSNVKADTNANKSSGNDDVIVTKDKYGGVLSDEELNKATTGNLKADPNVKISTKNDDVIIGTVPELHSEIPYMLEKLGVRCYHLCGCYFGDASNRVSERLKSSIVELF